MHGVEIHDRHHVLESLTSWVVGDFGGPHLPYRPEPPLPVRSMPLHPAHFSEGGLVQRFDASLQRGGQRLCEEEDEPAASAELCHVFIGAGHPCDHALQMEEDLAVAVGVRADSKFRGESIAVVAAPLPAAP
jgi:hypothetical protein